MKKRDKIIYWISTVWLSLAMLSSGIVQIIGLEEEVEMMNRLGYPGYFPVILGVWKMFGVVAILVPGFKVVKEWAYAGMFFTMSGAVLSHAIVSDPPMEYFGPSLTLVLVVVSYLFRPANRKI